MSKPDFRSVPDPATVVPSPQDAAARATVWVSRPDRPRVTARLIFLPRRGSTAPAKVQLPSGAYLLVPRECLTLTQARAQMSRAGAA